MDGVCSARRMCTPLFLRAQLSLAVRLDPRRLRASHSPRSASSAQEKLIF